MLPKRFAEREEIAAVRAEAEKAYDQARTIYRGIAKESIED